MSAPMHSDAELVHASLDGNRDAFGMIVTRYQALVCSLAYSATGSLSRSEDLAQDTFVAAWKKLPELRDTWKLRAWLCGIARNLISNAQRRASRDPAHIAEPFAATNEAVAPDKSPSEQAVSREEEAIMWRALGKIPETYREPLVLYYREHRSVERVARDLELSEDATRQRLSRGRALLHEQVIALVEGTLERSNPGSAFAGVVLSALPMVGATTTAAGVGSAGAKSSAAAKAASSAGGVGLAGILLGLLGVLGGYIGWQMSDTKAQTEPEREALMRFWRVVVGGFFLFLLPAFILMIGRQSHPWLQSAATWWLEGLYATVVIGFAIYAWRQHRRIRERQPAAEPAPPGSRRRLLAWVGLGTLAMALVVTFSIVDSGSWRTRWLSGAEAMTFIATHPYAQVYVEEFQDGSRSLSVRVDEGGHQARFVAPLDEATLAALKKARVTTGTLVQGRDFEIFGWAGRWLFLLALLISTAGAVMLARILTRNLSVRRP